MSITPAAGTYMVWYSAYIQAATTQQQAEFKIRAGGTDVTGSVKTTTVPATGVANQFTIAHTMARVTVDGTQAIDVQGRHIGGGATTFLDNQLMIALTS